MSPVYDICMCGQKLSEMNGVPLTLDPATTTLITNSSGPGVGIGTSCISVVNIGKGWTISSFIAGW